jgi:hypothetical protein
LGGPSGVGAAVALTVNEAVAQALVSLLEEMVRTRQ